MKKGISVWSFPSDWSLSKIFQTAKEAGFEGVEVALAQTGEINLDSTLQDMEKVKVLAKEHDVSLFSVASGLGVFTDVGRSGSAAKSKGYS